jgi:hypothetical protein
MGKILIGVATAAVWFALSHAASAEEICRQVCDDGTCVTKCVDRSDVDVTVRDRDDYRDRDRGPGVDVHVTGIGIQIGH